MEMALTSSIEMPSLPDIADAVPLSAEDAPLVSALVEVLKKHNALSRFGLSLLHQHFPINPDEVMVESTDQATRMQTIQPVKKDALAGLNTKITGWRLDTGQPLMACLCVILGKDNHQHLPRG